MAEIDAHMKREYIWQGWPDDVEYNKPTVPNVIKIMEGYTLVTVGHVYDCGPSRTRGKLKGSRFYKKALSEFGTQIYIGTTSKPDDQMVQSLLDAYKSQQSQIQALQTRLDAIDAEYVQEARFDAGLAEEIEKLIGDETVLDKIKPEDWIPSGSELDELLEDD